uniref:Kallikrein related peptidase 12 n=1 Tax=Spermophilus dauricus TaxID=99837 RepID=A0A8C9PPH5_SPEDA
MRLGITLLLCTLGASQADTEKIVNGVECLPHSQPWQVGLCEGTSLLPHLRIPSYRVTLGDPWYAGESFRGWCPGGPWSLAGKKASQESTRMFASMWIGSG